MDGNRRKLRNLLLYIGIPVAVLFIIVVLFNNRRPQQATYSKDGAYRPSSTKCVS